MKTIKIFFGSAALAATLLATSAVAQEKFTIAGGGGMKNGSTYSWMLGDLAKWCSTDSFVLEEVNTNGGIQNLEFLKGNKVKSAVIPSDLLLSAKLENPTSVAMIRTLFALHPEELHLIARGDIKKEGGVSIGNFNVGGTSVSYSHPEDLRGRAVGAVGGSVRSAQILSEFLKLNLKVTPFDDNLKLTNALLTGQIDAIVVVAGAPSALVQTLDSRFKLLPVRSNAELAAVYSPAKLQYEKLNGGKAVDTISTQALFVTRTFRDPDMLTSLAKLRACFTTYLPKIQDADGSHAKWQLVDSNDRGKWEYYDLPKVAAPVVVAPAAAPAKPKK